MDPVTISLAVGVASKAFSAIKEGFAIGRDIEQIICIFTDIGGYIFGKLFKAGSVEEAAMAAYAAKKKLEEQRYELKIFLNLTHGPKAYDELLQMEGQIRKQRQQTIYKQQQLRRQLGEGVAWIFLIVIIGGFILLLFSMFTNKSYADGYKYVPKPLTKQQLLNQGKIEKKKYTTCRLKKILKSKYTNKQACIYQGGNKTYTLMYEKNCPKQYKCLYDPGGKEPNIDQVMESLRSITK